MEMPIDIIKKHTDIRSGLVGPDGLTDGQRALNIDLELQRKFLHIPFEDIDTVEIVKDGDSLVAGSGPEGCYSQPAENPTWLYNHAVNALALWRKLDAMQKEEAAAEERERKRREKLAQRPQPGVYLGTSLIGQAFTVIVTEDRRVVVVQSEGDPLDMTETWDKLGQQKWMLRPINVATGTIAK